MNAYGIEENFAHFLLRIHRNHNSKIQNNDSMYSHAARWALPVSISWTQSRKLKIATQVFLALLLLSMFYLHGKFPQESRTIFETGSGVNLATEK